MHSAMFFWEAEAFDAEFDRLIELIDDAAQSLHGFLGAESWQSPDNSRKCAIYYWTNR